MGHLLSWIKVPTRASAFPIALTIFLLWAASASNALAAETPVVVDEWAASVNATTAIVDVKANPGGLPTTVTVEYGLTSSYGRKSARSLGEGEAELTASVPIVSLAPGTLYHYRVVTTNTAGSVVGLDHTFTSRASASPFTLPDGRNYVQVTPVDKNGSGAYGVANGVHSSPDGSRLESISLVGFPGSKGLQEFPTNLSVFSGSGWTTAGLLPPGTSPTSQFQIRGYSRDLRYALIESTASLTPQAAGGTNHFYVYDSVSEAYVLIEPQRAPGVLPGELPVVMLASSNDDSKLFIETNEQLLPQAPSEVSNVYEWSGGHLALVDTGSAGGASAGPEGGAESGALGYRTVSSDGERVVFTDNTTGQIYMRIGTSTTVRVSGPPVEPAEPPLPATWRESTTDGRFVFFTSENRLTSSAHASAGHADLYRYDSDTNETVDLTPATASGAAVLGTYGVSSDGSFVYFAAEEALAVGGSSGAASLYVWHDGQLRFIAPQTGFEDSENWKLYGETRLNLGGGLRTSRVTPSGLYALFASDLPLTGFDNHEIFEIFRYDFAQNRIVCVSCNPSNARAHKPPYLVSLPGTISSPAASAFVLSENLATDGSVYFSSFEQLTPQDLNNVADAYEWNTTDESLHLLSTGTSDESAYFADASEDGTNVFFFTSQSLVPVDNDKTYDVYDARRGPPLASQYPASSAPPCEPSTCSGVGRLAPETPSSASSAELSGPGNVSPVASLTKPVGPPVGKPRSRKAHKGKKHRRVEKSRGRARRREKRR